MKINIEKWHVERLAVEEKIRALKRLIRKEPRDMEIWGSLNGKSYGSITVTAIYGSYKDYALLGNLKNQATLLYKVRAQFRGRQHQLQAVTYKSKHGHNLKEIETLTVEIERKQVEELMTVYALKEDSVATA